MMGTMCWEHEKGKVNVDDSANPNVWVTNVNIRYSMSTNVLININVIESDFHQINEPKVARI